MQNTFISLAPHTTLLPGEAMERRGRNRDYMMKLLPENLLLSHYLEAGLMQMSHRPEGIHWGWDAPTSEIRGTVCGHWLSAAAHMHAEYGDAQLLARANFIVAEIARCQVQNGGRWAFPIPEKYLYNLRDGKGTWAPQYVCHKNMMGLLDMYRLTGNEQALEILLRCAEWFDTFSKDISREQMSDMMDLRETGGIMELWADLYAITGDETHLALMRRYERPRLANPLLEGIDVLTNMHANTTIPEILGYARAYEVTGEDMYRQAAEAYWRQAVDARGAFATGGQSSGEVWTPKMKLAARLGDKTQEHCVVYNMMRLAEYLLRWMGEAKYADYWERNLYNGIFAQGYWRSDEAEMLAAPHYRETTTVAYYLPLMPGATKHWGSELEHFWCCHCTLLQANAIHHESIYYRTADGVAITQYLPSSLTLPMGDNTFTLTQTFHPMTGENSLAESHYNRDVPSRPHATYVRLQVKCTQPQQLSLSFRAPGWLHGDMRMTVNGEAVTARPDAQGFVTLTRVWQDDSILLEMPKALTCVPLPDAPDMVAFVDGPICLAGLTDSEHMLYGDSSAPEGSLLCPDDERHWSAWRSGWKTYRQPVGIRFKPLYQIGHEQYTVYFPIEKR